ncbi:MAG: molybdopterin-guanine dinucleotide biosynthesis protein B [Gammaproteobacteria bacterium]|nr:molybdopterin-guanine dinucleotide biosynthesis protein B [Gammaproteobacteria bacterium]
MLDNASIPILGFVAPSGTGKTTLLKTLIALCKAKDIRLAVIKHSHHDFEIDTPGKDSYELRKAGAEQMLIASRYRWALISESCCDANEVDLNSLLLNLDQNQLDLILVEGFKQEHFPKIELLRAPHHRLSLAAADPDIIAIATDDPDEPGCELPCLDLNDAEQILRFIIRYFNLATSDASHYHPDKD